MSKKFIYIFLSSLIIIIFTISSIDDEIFKINKSFELLGEVYRNINEQYVDEIDPEILFNAAINGMLSVLDPYTEYYNENNEEDVEYLKTGEYIGFGMTVDIKQGKLTIVELLDGCSASLSGLRIGDRIYKIDTAIVIDKSLNYFKKFTEGKIGEKVNIKILRDGLKDTLSFFVNRMKIFLPDVKFSEIINDSIGYINLERFTEQATESFKTNLRNLYNTGKLKSLIIDLRNNPGGLLQTAIDICSHFVPKNTIIVTLKDRQGNIRNYTTHSEPFFRDLPIVVLINEYSASASEILAGALQDLDRAVIVGKRSFGKGLVQIIIALPYDAYLKLTTSKYYIPSGRCIQKIQYNNKMNQQDHIFYSENGRKLIEANGVIPDSTVENKKNDLIVEDLKLNDYFFNFANFWSSKFNELPNEINNKDKIISDFLNYLQATDYYNNTTVMKKIVEIEELISETNVSNINSEISRLKNKIEEYLKRNILKKKDIIYEEIKDEILKRFYSNLDYLKYKLLKDEYINLASQLLKKKNYEKILKISRN